MFPISAAAIARSHTLGEPRWSPGGGHLAWLDAAGGRVDIVVAPVDGSAPAVVVTADEPVTPIGAYGGGGFCWASPNQLVYAAADGRLLAIPVTGGPARVLSVDGRAAAPTVAPGGDRVAFVLERDHSCDVAVVALDGRSWPTRVSYADYAWDPAWSPDGVHLAWHEWDLPAMPWDASRIALATVPAVASGLATADTERDAQVVAGGTDIAVAQPRFAPDGRSLAYLSDVSGWMNVWIADSDGGNARVLAGEAHEQAEPAWGPGQRSFAWAPDSTEIAVNRNEFGFGRLVAVSVADGASRDLARGWHRGLDWGDHGIVGMRSGGRTAPQVTVVDPSSGVRRSWARGAVAALDAVELPEPRTVSWSGDDGAAVYGLLWCPADSSSGRPGPAPTAPLLVDVHGGPTDQAVVDWMPRIRYFVSRGWAVLCPNYRGSSGYGRPYERALDESWGVLDVADTVAGIRAADREGWADGTRVAVMGGSAGGFTALLVAATAPPVVRAAVSLFGVTDLFGLAETTHRFESRYLDRLVGALPEHAARYRERSPVTRAADVAVPVLVLQGADDQVVPAAQAQLMVDAMRAAGAPVEHHVYEGEGHGWRKPDTIIDSFERIDAFLTRWVLTR